MPKVLIVEDDKYLSHAYKIKLEANSFEVLMASDGNEALKVIQESKPDIILLDLIMPIKDGFTTLKEIKEHAEWKNIPIIITSNLSQKEDADRVKALGANDYIIKADLSLKILIEKINTALGLDATTATPS